MNNIEKIYKEAEIQLQSLSLKENDILLIKVYPESKLFMSSLSRRLFEENNVFKKLLKEKRIKGVIIIPNSISCESLTEEQLNKLGYYRKDKYFHRREEE